MNYGLKASFEERVEKLGFTFWNTGGNVMCYGMNVRSNDTYYLLTDIDGEVPIFEEEELLLGTYSNDDGDCIKNQAFENLEELEKYLEYINN